ncbi:hypothetical protein LEP1GSC124_2615 [Leptospira interrogans serovar Pyrogenes str. 200701872]|nr:hypothetical protein LEP1GSC124_2615 [Leptospira interrogans serovar Pyrogenes str. 200701872]
MNQSIEKYESKMKRRYITSARHTMQVDFEVFLYDMKSELKKGIKRAAKNGNKLPVPALAQNKSILSNDISVKRFKNKTELFSEI